MSVAGVWSLGEYGPGGLWSPTSPMDRMTYTSENITFPQLCLWAVIKILKSKIEYKYFVHFPSNKKQYCMTGEIKLTNSKI